MIRGDILWQQNIREYLYEIDKFYGFVSLEDYLRGCLEEIILSNQKTDNVIMGNDVYLVDMDSILDICYATLFTLHNHVNSHKFVKNDKLNETIRFYFRDICKQIGVDEIGERIVASFIRKYNDFKSKDIDETCENRIRRFKAGRYQQIEILWRKVL